MGSGYPTWKVPQVPTTNFSSRQQQSAVSSSGWRCRDASLTRLPLERRMEGEARFARHLGVCELVGGLTDLDLEPRTALVVESVRVLGDQVLARAYP